MFLLGVIMADQVYQYGLRLAVLADKGRRGWRCRRERQAGASRFHRRLQNLLSMLPSMVDHAPPNRAAQRRPIVVLPIKRERIAAAAGAAEV